LNGSKKMSPPCAVVRGGEIGAFGAVLQRVSATGELLRDELAECGALGTAR
jgi:hypothetical protein